MYLIFLKMHGSNECTVLNKRTLFCNWKYRVHLDLVMREINVGTHTFFCQTAFHAGCCGKDYGSRTNWALPLSFSSATDTKLCLVLQVKNGWFPTGKENKIVSLQLFVKEEKVVNIRKPIKISKWTWLVLNNNPRWNHEQSNDFKWEKIGIYRTLIYYL